MREKKQPYYPIFLDLSGRRCVVVGAGNVAERKISGLLKTGAAIVVVGPPAAPAIEKWALEGSLTLMKRAFTPADLDDAFLVIAATDDEQLNELVQREALRRKALINVVDAPNLCEFIVPAVLDRGRLQIAVSTGGASPALAAKLRDRIETEVGPEYGDYVEVIDDFRRRVRTQTSDSAKRKEAYERLFASDVLDRIKIGQKVDVDELVGRYAG